MGEHHETPHNLIRLSTSLAKPLATEEMSLLVTGITVMMHRFLDSQSLTSIQGGICRMLQSQEITYCSNYSIHVQEVSKEAKIK